MASALSLSRLKQGLLLLGAILPLAFLAQLVWEQMTPRAAREASINLHGAWKVLPGAQVDGASPALDDSTARSMKVPGKYRAQGFEDPSCWLRRHFEAPPALLGQPLFLTLSGTRTGFGRYYLNGQLIGETQSVPHGPMTEMSGREGWAIPAGVLRPGENVLAMHFDWAWIGIDGIGGSDVLLGPESLLGKHYIQAGESRRAVQYGAGSVMLFLLLLFAALLAADWESPNRPLYLAACGVIVASSLYLGTRAGIFFAIPIQSRWNGPAVYAAALVILYTQPDFVLRYVIGARSRFRRINLWVCNALAAFLAVALISSNPSLVAGAFVLIGGYGIVAVLFITFVALNRAFRGPLGLDTILCSGVLCCSLTGTAELFQSLGMIPAVNLYALGVSASAITSGVVLIADFTKVSFDNKKLTQSLKRTNADLADALVRAQEAARIKSEFVANVSHELRTPLNSVLNVPEGLMEQFRKVEVASCSACGEVFEIEPGDVVDAVAPCPVCKAKGLSRGDDFRFVGVGKVAMKGLQQIHRAGTHLLELIEDVLDFSKLEAGRMRLSLEEVDVRAALQNVLDTLEPLAAKQRIQLVLDVTSASELRVDSVKLSQIFINLVGNAVKFSPEGAEVRVTASLEGNDWVFAVIDRGIGIAPEHHQIIFESFRQVNGSNTRKFGGTGLGLAITRRLAEAHGGKVWVESVKGKGSTFFVRLPRQGPDDSERAPLPQPLPASALGRTVLILDDERFAVENLKLALQPLGHRIESIEDPRLLEKTIERVKPDLLILDVMLPGLSGLDILKLLRARNDTVPVLVSSAYHSNMDIVRALGASWLAKPWRSDELQSEVTRLLLQKHLEISTGAATGSTPTVSVGTGAGSTGTGERAA